MSNFKKVMMAAAGGSVPAKYLVTYQSTGKIWDIQNNYADVTSTFKPSATTSAAGSHERLFHGWQDNGYKSKWIGFGGWGRYSAIGGAIWDISNSSSQWSGYNNYDGTVYVFGGGGGASVNRIVPHANSGNHFYFRCDDIFEIGINSILSPSSTNVSSVPSTLNTTSYQAATWGDYIVYTQGAAQNHLHLASFNSSTGAIANITSDNTIANGGTDKTPAISKSGNVIAYPNDTMNRTIANGGAIKVWDQYNITEYNGSTKVLQGNYTSLDFSGAGTLNSGQPIEALAISDDDRWIAAGYRLSFSPYYGVRLWDRNNSYAITDVTVPAGSGTNARPIDIVFYPDNDTFFMSGYINAPNILCSASQGTYTRNFSSFGANAESKMSSSFGCTVLPEDWFDGLY